MYNRLEKVEDPADVIINDDKSQENIRLLIISDDCIHLFLVSINFRIEIVPRFL